MDQAQIPRSVHDLEEDGEPNVSAGDVAEREARPMLQNYLSEELEREGIADPVVLRQLTRSRNLQQEVEFARLLRVAGDRLSADPEFQRLSQLVTEDCSKETFINVAATLFSDGVFNLGRIAALFVFALFIVRKNLGRLRVFVDWTIDFFRERVAPWIVGRGGWSLHAGSQVSRRRMAVYGVTGMAVFATIVYFGRR